MGDPEITIALLAKYPKLLQRPIIVTPQTAIIGRPRDRVPALFD
ncbi:MAG: ArsC/Spx/MgsR family protein [Acidimicrobiales bacterium]